MGELGIGITDLDVCPECGHTTAMIFENEKTGWYVACWNNTCCHKTDHHLELLDAASEWGLL